MKNLILSLLLLFCMPVSFAQKKNTQPSRPNDEVMKLYYDYMHTYDFTQFIINISLKSFWVDLSQLEDSKSPTPDNLDSLLEALKEDKENPILLNQIAETFKASGDIESMHEFYIETYKNLDVKYFEGDSARFYSFRAVLKTNIGGMDSSADFDKALEYNPNDETALLFYPMTLIFNDDFSFSSKKLIELMALSDDKNLFYFFIRWNEMVAAIKKMNEEGQKNKITYDFTKRTFESIRNKSVDIENKGLKQVIDDQMDLYKLFYLWSYFHDLKMNKQKIDKQNYKEFKKLVNENIQRTNNNMKSGEMNQFLYNKTLGYNYFFLDDFKKSKAHLEKALSHFPKSKRDKEFNENDIYHVLLCIASMSKEENQALNYIDEFLSDTSRIETIVFELYRLPQLIRVGKYEEAKAYAVDLFNSDIVDFHVVLSIILYLFDEEDYQFANSLLNTLEQNITSELEEYLAMSFLSAMLFAMNQTDEAKQWLTRAKDLNTKHNLFTNEKEAIHIKIEQLFTH